MDLPKNNLLFILGYLGFLSLIYQSRYVGIDSKIEYGDITGKFIQSLSIFISAPYLTLFYPKIYSINAPKNSKKIIIYTFLLVIMAIALNVRGFIFGGVFNLILIMILYMALGNLKFNFGMKHFIILIALIPVFSLATDLVFSMAVAREFRKDNSPVEMVVETLDILSDRDRLNHLKKLSLDTVFSDYSEDYTGNVMIDRLLSVKFSDLTITEVIKMPSDNVREVVEFSRNKIFSTLPTPILRIIGSNIDKNENTYSMGDFLRYGSGGFLSQSFLTGSNVAHALILFGNLFFLILIPYFVIVMVVIHSFEINIRGTFFISPLILMNLNFLLNFFNSDSLVDGMQFITRGLFQYGLIYFIIFLFYKKMSINNS
ncbi:hypothetical protein [Polynucleobacter sp. P1-05-14]|uniref:hypothetical protein n=1 Tax=Polynucleobacter sp. P1-05-14 TaxID=1819732 RepID=UPI001C0D387A|nr:hypothetical protein [Polynucleobacter sp. P1-05-14]